LVDRFSVPASIPGNTRELSTRPPLGVGATPPAKSDHGTDANRQRVKAARPEKKAQGAIADAQGQRHEIADWLARPKARGRVVSNRTRCDFITQRDAFRASGIGRMSQRFGNDHFSK
jgi:hypothetical protein